MVLMRVSTIQKKLKGKTVRNPSVPITQRWKDAKVRLTPKGEVQVMVPVGGRSKAAKRKRSASGKRRQNPYPVYIGVSKSGETVVSKKDIDALRRAGDPIVSYSRVYGSQIRHRVAAKTPHGWEIMTPTEARRLGYTTTNKFPVQP